MQQVVYVRLVCSQLLFDDDDRVCLFVSRLLPFRFAKTGPPPVAAIFACEMDLASGTCWSRPVTLAKSATTSCAERRHIIKRAGWYYLLLAEGGTDEHH